jgi:hypothetical protein
MEAMDAWRTIGLSGVRSDAPGRPRPYAERIHDAAQARICIWLRIRLPACYRADNATMMP